MKALCKTKHRDPQETLGQEMLPAGSQCHPSKRGTGKAGPREMAEGSQGLQGAVPLRGEGGGPASWGREEAQPSAAPGSRLPSPSQPAQPESGYHGCVGAAPSAPSGRRARGMHLLRGLRLAGLGAHAGQLAAARAQAAHGGPRPRAPPPGAPPRPGLRLRLRLRCAPSPGPLRPAAAAAACRDARPALAGTRERPEAGEPGLPSG